MMMAFLLALSSFALFAAGSGKGPNWLPAAAAKPRKSALKTGAAVLVFAAFLAAISEAGVGLGLVYGVAMTMLTAAIMFLALNAKEIGG